MLQYCFLDIDITLVAYPSKVSTAFRVILLVPPWAAVVQWNLTGYLRIGVSASLEQTNFTRLGVTLELLVCFSLQWGLNTLNHHEFPAKRLVCCVLRACNSRKSQSSFWDSCKVGVIQSNVRVCYWKCHTHIADGSEIRLSPPRICIFKDSLSVIPNSHQMLGSNLSS